MIKNTSNGDQLKSKKISQDVMKNACQKIRASR